MPDLYLVWKGTATPDDGLWGLRCSSALPAWEQPQQELVNYGLDVEAGSGLSLAALSNRILLTCGYQNNSTNFHYIGSSICQSWPNWVNIANTNSIPGAASNSTPAVTNFGAGGIAAWVGIGSDTRIWTSLYNDAQNVWSSQYLTALANTGAPIQSGAGPALINCNGLLLMVWRGEGSNDTLYYATSTDGQHWKGNEAIPGAASTNSPALAIFNGSPVLCFKGGTNDGGIYSTTYNVASDHWATVVHTGPFGTTSSPTLAVYQGKLFMAWKGDGNDTDIWWSITSNNLDPNAWSGQANVSNVGTTAGPAAIVY